MAKRKKNKMTAKAVKIITKRRIKRKTRKMLNIKEIPLEKYIKIL
jgi:hypothetical protein